MRVIPVLRHVESLVFVVDVDSGGCVVVLGATACSQMHPNLEGALGTAAEAFTGATTGGPAAPGTATTAGTGKVAEHALAAHFPSLPEEPTTQSKF